MARKGYTPEQIIGKLREVEVLVHEGQTIREAVRRIGVSDHTYYGPEFTSRAVIGWLSNLGVKAMFIEPGSPWENGYVESFNGKFRDELLNREVFSTLTEARTLIEWWRKDIQSGTEAHGPRRRYSLGR